MRIAPKLYWFALDLIGNANDLNVSAINFNVNVIDAVNVKVIHIEFNWFPNNCIGFNCIAYDLNIIAIEMMALNVNVNVFNIKMNRSNLNLMAFSLILHRNNLIESSSIPIQIPANPCNCGHFRPPSLPRA